MGSSQAIKERERQRVEQTSEAGNSQLNFSEYYLYTNRYRTVIILRRPYYSALFFSPSASEEPFSMYLHNLSFVSSKGTRAHWEQVLDRMTFQAEKSYLS